MSTSQSKAIPFFQALGTHLKQLRGNISQEELAFAARRAGLPWRRNLVAQIEVGKRHLTLEEFVVLPAVFSTFRTSPIGWKEILPMEFKKVAITKDLFCNPGVFDKLLESRGVWTPEIEHHFDSPQSRLEQMFSPAVAIQEERIHLAALGDAEMKAARLLRVDAVTISRAAFRLWDRSLTAQRDQKLAERGVDPAVDARRAQAIRGHITRELLDDLGPLVKKSATHEKSGKRSVRRKTTRTKAGRTTIGKHRDR